MRDNYQEKKFGKYYPQCNIGTDSPGSRKPSVEF